MAAPASSGRRQVGQPPRRAADDQHEHAEPDRRLREEDPALAGAEVVRPLDLRRAEVGSRIDRDRLGSAVARSHDDHGGLRDDHRGDERDRQAPGLPHRTDSRHARRDRVRHPRQPARLRGGDRRRAGGAGRGAVVPRRPRRLRRRPRRVRRARRGQLRDLPGRQPRPRRRRVALAGGLLARRRARRPVDHRRHPPRDARVPARPLRRGRGRGHRALPRLAARPDLGVRPLRPDRRAVPRRGAAARLADRPLPRRALLQPPRGGAGLGLDAPRRRPARHRGGRVAAQPRLDRPAARRRPARGLAGPRHARRGRPSGGARTTTSRAPRPRSAPRGCPTRSPSGSQYGQ